MRLTTSSLLETQIVRKPWMTALEISDGSKYMRQGRKKDLRIGTWNLLTLYKGGALKQLEKVLASSSIRKTKSSHKIIFHQLRNANLVVQELLEF
jgi:hypothetical protein